MASTTRRKRPKKLSLPMRILRALYMILLVVSILIVVGYAAFRLLIKAPDVDSQITFPPDVPVSASPDPNASAQVTPPPSQLVLTRRTGVYTCLLLGSDDGNGMADTIMLGVFDTGKKTASLVSIPRDTLIDYNGNRKINSTYGLGGPELVQESVSSLLGVPVDFYVSVDLEAFSAIVNEIGGVWFDVPVDMDYEDPYQDLYIHISAGYQKLNGKQAIGVMRCRSCYANADIGRVATQRAFLAALADQTITLSNVTKVTSLINILNQYVVSDMPLDTMVYFATQAIGMDLNTGLSSATLEGEWVTPFYELDDEAVLELVNSLGVYEEEVPMAALDIQHR